MELPEAEHHRRSEAERQHRAQPAEGHQPEEHQPGRPQPAEDHQRQRQPAASQTTSLADDVRERAYDA